MYPNLATILQNREISSKRDYKQSIELLLESSYFTRSKVKHLAEDFPLNETGLNCHHISQLFDQLNFL